VKFKRVAKSRVVSELYLARENCSRVDVCNESIHESVSMYLNVTNKKRFLNIVPRNLKLKKKHTQKKNDLQRLSIKKIPMKQKCRLYN